MATTNWETADVFQASHPHSFNALQKLVMAMARYQRDRDKRTFLGKDKGLDAYKRFEEELRDTLLAMAMDGAVNRTADPSEYRETLIEMIDLFAAAFPNWQDAYSYASEYFIAQAEVAEGQIQDMTRT